MGDVPQGDELPEGFGPGPYGYLVMPPGLDESEWTLESDPVSERDRAEGYKCVALYAASPNAGAVSEGELRKVAMAIKSAELEDKYGKYDYSAYPGDEPPYVIIDHATGAIVFRSRDYSEAERMYMSLCEEHVARAALSSLGIKVGG